MFDYYGKYNIPMIKGVNPEKRYNNGENYTKDEHGRFTGSTGGGGSSGGNVMSKNEKSQKKILTNAVGESIIEVEHTTIVGKPNSITQRVAKNGGIDRNYYDETGKQFKQISNNDHYERKAPSYGKHGEHAHDYVYDETGKLIGRPKRGLNDMERKENSDIL